VVDAIKNKIDATDTNISKLLKDKKFTIDFFQREYRWQEKHIRMLVDDLTSAFLKSFNPEHRRSDVANYQGYYLGPVVFSINTETGKKSIIDGQQRITSITLLLIYLNNLQKRFNNKVAISDLVFSEQYGEKSFNMSDDDRDNCLSSLFDHGDYSPNDEDNETVKNMINRYEDIEQAFPEDIAAETVLPYFIDWLIGNVTIVEITAYSEENAYTIFETMNDRGLNLTPTEMLKGFILSKITDKKQRTEINDLWKKEIQSLHDFDEDSDQSFFQAWFRGCYANSIRPGKAGSEDQDFELIGSRFHNWFRDNYKVIFGLSNSADFYLFFKKTFPFYVKWFTRIMKAQADYDKQAPHLHYIAHWGIADSLQYPLLLAAISPSDSEQEILSKIDLVARYIETFTVRRAVNFRKFSQASIKYTMFNLIKSIRAKDITNLGNVLANSAAEIPETWDGIYDFVLHGMNRNFVKHLLCRISAHIDTLAGKDANYIQYHHPNGKQYEIEHIWADKFEEHRDEFDQQNDFSEWRNSIGALLLLPNGTNQSFNSDRYEDKVEHYLKENTYAQSLHPLYYERNPNFANSDTIRSLGFSAHPHFKKADIEDRLALVQNICEHIWSIDSFIAPNGNDDIQ
jgi:uncharacterized protein with ParB-like and HNH nuclease domain